MKQKVMAPLVEIGPSPVEVAVLAAVLLALIVLVLLVVWPRRTEQSDVMQGVHGDQPRMPS